MYSGLTGLGNQPARLPRTQLKPRRRMLKGWDCKGRISVHPERNALWAPTTDKTYTTYGTNRGRPTSPIGPICPIGPIRCRSQSAFFEPETPMRPRRSTKSVADFCRISLGASTDKSAVRRWQRRVSEPDQPSSSNRPLPDCRVVVVRSVHR